MSCENLHLLMIEGSTFCNAKCPMCPRYVRLDNNEFSLLPGLTPSHLSYEVIKQSIDLTKFPNLRYVSFVGDTGDSAMNPDILKIFKFFIQSKKILVTLNTNGSIGNQRFWEELATLENFRVVVSLDGLEDTNHLYRVGLNYKTIIKNLETFISNGGVAVWKCLLWKHNQHQIDQIIETAKKLKFTDVFFMSPIVERFNNQDWHLIDEKTNEKYELALPTVDVQKKYNLIPRHKCSHFLNINEMVLPEYNTLCSWSKEGKKYIDVSGNVLPCCSMHREPFLYRDQFNNSLFNLDQLNLANFTLDQILSNAFYTNKLENSLRSTDTAYDKCRQICSFMFDDKSNGAAS